MSRAEKFWNGPICQRGEMDWPAKVSTQRFYKFEVMASRKVWVGTDPMLGFFQSGKVSSWPHMVAPHMKLRFISWYRNRAVDVYTVEFSALL